MTTPKGLFGLVAIVCIVLMLGAFLLLRSSFKHEAMKAIPTEQTATFDKTLYSLNDPTSIWVIVNKQRQLDPKEYEPADLRTPNMDVESADMKLSDATSTALEKLASAASKEGVDFVVASAYRSYSEQKTVYASMVRGYGQEEADRESARPGHSEHQTGLALDLGSKNGLCRIEACFANTKEGKWLAANAYKYGFIIRYAEGKEQITGYNYEPWHIRYIGTLLSTDMHRTNTQTLEEFFGLPPAPNY